MNKISGRGSSQPQISRVNHPTINSNSQFNFPQQQSGQQQRNVYSHAPKNQQLASSPPQNTPPVSTIPQSVQLTIVSCFIEFLSSFIKLTFYFRIKWTVKFKI